ncbi:MAG: transposase [Rhodothermaceae bacterium]|nr:MAG: transposase [Rhodothermaceae bacterium]
MLSTHIRALYYEHRGRYGAPRIHAQLRRQQGPVGRNRVARLMRRAGLSATAPRRYVCTTDSGHRFAVAHNTLDRRFDVPLPNLVWGCDITYVATGQGWLYLAVVLDLGSRRVVGHATRASLERTLVHEALAMALGRRGPVPGLLHHSDRGSQYASTSYQEQLRAAGIEASMSRRGNCWDNAFSRTIVRPWRAFFATLKRELVRGSRFDTRAQARQAIFAYIECYYNTKRLHSSLGYQTPAQYEALFAECVPTTNKPGRLNSLSMKPG